MLKTILCLSTLLVGSHAFISQVTPTPQRTSHTAVFGMNIDAIEDVGYYVTVKKPLGVVFGENSQPYAGLRVDEVELGSEGERVGLRIGDQLMAVSGEPVIGDGFDSAMGVLQTAPAKMKLLLFRGNVRDLYTIMDNRGVEADDDDGSQVVIMDENYESPVRVEVKEDTGFDFGKAFSKLAGGGAKKEAAAAPPKQEQKKGGGLFGMFGESIQLDGEDATGTGR